MLPQDLGVLFIPDHERDIFLSCGIASTRPVSLIRTLRIPKATTSLNGMRTLKLGTGVMVLPSVVHLIAAIHAPLMRSLALPNAHASSKR